MGKAKEDDWGSTEAGSPPPYHLLPSPSQHTVASSSFPLVTIEEGNKGRKSAGHLQSTFDYRCV